MPLKIKNNLCPGKEMDKKTDCLLENVKVIIKRLTESRKRLLF
jgi:hypothetical protein